MERYSRHLLLKEIGREGQERLAEGRVLIIGCGGLGSPVAMYLAAAGVGTIGLMDGDVVDESNLQRQVIHFTADVGRPKVVSAAEKLRAINPHCRIIEIPEFFTAPLLPKPPKSHRSGQFRCPAPPSSSPAPPPSSPNMTSSSTAPTATAPNTSSTTPV